VPCLVFHGGGSQNSFLDDAVPPSASFDQLSIRQISIVAKVFINPPLKAAGVCEKTDGVELNNGFVFGWSNAGAMNLAIENSATVLRVRTADATVETGRWLQLAFTWDGTGLGAAVPEDAQFYLDAVKQANIASSQGAPGGTDVPSQPFRIGNGSTVPMVGSLDGYMAYLVVYRNRILTPTELLQLDQQLPIKTAL
jgi:hypothetical protein